MGWRTSTTGGQRADAPERRPAASPAVEVVGLVLRYGRKVAVDGVSLTVSRGKITALLGPNGAGKTTTVEVCEGYRRPDAGLVRVLGCDPRRDARVLRPRVGVMLQQGGVYPTVKAEEMLRHVASLHAHPLDVPDLLERLGLASVVGTRYRRLSGGQQRRLSLALAVVGRPELVFLDEPTTGMDPLARHATWDLVEALRRDGVTVVLTTHFMDEAERLADQVAVLDHGKVFAAGTPEQLTATAGSDSVRFSGPAGLDLSSLHEALPGGTAVTEPTTGSYVVNGSVNARLLADLTRWCADRGVMPEGLTVARRSLEDAFLQLTGSRPRP